MSVTRDSTRVIGWAWEGTAETDPINAADALYWKFGVDANKYKYAVERHNWVPYYDGSGRDPTRLKLVRTEVVNSVGFFPTTGIPLYMFLGDGSSAAGVHSITGLDSGSLDTFTIRWEKSGGTDSLYQSAVGCKCQSINLSMDLEQKAVPMACGLAFNGIKTTTATLNSAHNGTKHATSDYTMTGTEMDDRYRYDSNFAFTWDYGSSNDDFTKLLLRWNYNGVNMLNLQGLQNQAEVEYIDEGNRQHQLDFEFISGGVSGQTYEANWWAEYLADTLHDVRITVYNTSTNYVTLDFDDVGLTVEQEIAKFDEQPKWKCSGIVKSVSATVKDGVSTSFYPNF